MRMSDWSSDVCSSDPYRALLADCRKWLERYFARRMAPHHIDDLVQETLVSMHRKLATWDSGRAFLPWLAAIDRYRWIDMLRRKRDEAELGHNDAAVGTAEGEVHARPDERSVGKAGGGACRSRWWQYPLKKKKKNKE